MSKEGVSVLLWLHTMASPVYRSWFFSSSVQVVVSRYTVSGASLFMFCSHTNEFSVSRSFHYLAQKQKQHMRRVFWATPTRLSLLIAFVIDNN